MKIPYVTMAFLAGVSVICSSCASPTVGYASYSVPSGINAGVAWTNASYDANGFPIFGYSYGRPVYGYTSAGVAIFTIAALTALCFVPHWGPASWYKGHHHYPKGIHRVAAPPRFPAGHAPGVRPPSGIKPPPAPQGHPGMSPGGAAPRPHVPGHAAAPQLPNHHGQHGSASLPHHGGKNIVPAPGAPSLPGGSRQHGKQNPLPGGAGHSFSPLPSGSAGSGVRTLPAMPGQKIMPVPSASGNKGGVGSMPAAPGHKVSPMLPSSNRAVASAPGKSAPSFAAPASKAPSFSAPSGGGKASSSGADRWRNRSAAALGSTHGGGRHGGKR